MRKTSKSLMLLLVFCFFKIIQSIPSIYRELAQFVVYDVLRVQKNQ